MHEDVASRVLEPSWTILTYELYLSWVLGGKRIKQIQTNKFKQTQQQLGGKRIQHIRTNIKQKQQQLGGKRIPLGDHPFRSEDAMKTGVALHSVHFITHQSFAFYKRLPRMGRINVTS